MKQIKDIFNIKKNNHPFKLSEVIIITLSFTIIFSLLTGYIVYSNFSGGDTNTNDIIKTYNKIIKTYYEDVNKDELSDSAIDGMMTYLDEKYSEYLDVDDTLALNNRLDGSYKGIGVQITKDDDGIKIVHVYDNTPASKAGLKKDDVIKEIDGKDIGVLELKEVVELIKNKKKTELTILRKGKEKKFKIDIKEIDNPVVSYKIFEKDDKRVGYIYLASFSKGSYSQVRNALKKLENDNIDSLIFDVRSNVGGYLTSASDIISMFVKKDKPIYTLKEKKKKTTYYDETKESRDYPIVVLIDHISASASEVLASALKESYGAIIVGTPSYGKGKVQQTNTLSDSSMVKYTTAKWYTPSGKSIDEVGVEPGIYVELTKEYAENPGDETDAQLQKALEVIVKR